jgi:hypothetical protein
MIQDPITSNKEIALNLNGDWMITLVGGEKIGITDYLNSFYLSPIEELFSVETPSEEDEMVLNEFKNIISKLDQGKIESLDDSIEWIIKKRLIDDLHLYDFEGDIGENDAKTVLLNQYMAVTDPLFDELVDERKVRTLIHEEKVEEAFLEPPKDSRGKLRVALANEFNNSIKSISWAYIKLNPMIRYHPVEFNELDGWTQEKIDEMITVVRSYVSE